jgi:tetratricopeptide (TPR) repeat protein
MTSTHTDSVGTADEGASAIRRLDDIGYWPLSAMKLVESGQYAAAVRICREHLSDPDFPLSGRVAYGQALYHAGQHEAAAEQFRLIMAVDPDHLAALKFLGEIAFALGDEWTAMANYRRILDIDPHTRGLRSPVRRIRNREVTRTISLVRHSEETSADAARTSQTTVRHAPPRRAAIVSETIGDLYLAQGHARQAIDVYQRLYDQQPSSRLADKLASALDKISERESTHVSETNE